MIDEDDARTIARLYEAALDRDGEIDRDGLNFWIDVFEARVAAGDSPEAALEGVAAAFLASPEFAAAVGDPAALGDRALVEVLYANLLERPGDQAGIDFWTAALAEPGFDRAALLVAFAESAEAAAANPAVDGLAEVAPGEWWFAPGLGGDDLPEGPETPASISGDGGELIGSIAAPDDVDWIEVRLEAGAEYAFRATGSTNDPLVDPAIALYHSGATAADLPIAINDDRDRFDPAIFYRPAADESVYLAVRADAFGIGNYRVQVTASDIATEDPRADPTTQYHLRLEDGAWSLTESFGAGALGEGDAADWYSAVLGAGQTWRFELSGDAEGLALVLRDAAGDPLASAGDVIEISPAATDTHYLSVELAEGAASYELEAFLV